MKTVIFNNRPPYLEIIEQELQLPQIENTEFLVIELFAGCGKLRRVCKVLAPVRIERGFPVKSYEIF
jgi:hypothetical protein